MGFLLPVSPDRFNLAPVSPVRAQRVVIYGPPGVGKTTLASLWENPALIDAERGADNLATLMTLGTPESQIDVLSMVSWVATYGAKAGVKTLVIDSIDAIEPIIWHDVCLEGAKASIDSFEFGRGYAIARDKLQQILNALDEVIKVGIEVVIIAHATVETVKDPTGNDFQRYNIALQRRAAETLVRWADSILFLELEKSVRVEKGTKTGKAMGDGDRVIHTAHRPSALAKSRRPLPEEIEIGMDPTFAEFFKYWRS